MDDFNSLHVDHVDPNSLSLRGVGIGEGLQRRVHTVHSNLRYIGFAPTSAEESDDSWRIYRELTENGVAKVTLAGNGKFDQIWDNRTSLFTASTYTNEYSVDFDGVNDYVSCGLINYRSLSESWSYSLWVKPQNFAASRYVVAKMTNDASAWGWALGFTTLSKVQTQMRGTTGHSSDAWPTSLTAGAWTHIVWTYSGSGNKSGQEVYINGTKEVFTPGSGTLAGMDVTLADFVFGQRGQSNLYYVGALNNVSFWNKVLSQSEVTSLYNSGDPPDISALSFYDDCLSWYKCGTNDTYPTLIDQKGVGNGTMTNMDSGDIIADVP